MRHSYAYFAGLLLATSLIASLLATTSTAQTLQPNFDSGDTVGNAFDDGAFATDLPPDPNGTQSDAFLPDQSNLSPFDDATSNVDEFSQSPLDADDFNNSVAATPASSGGGGGSSFTDSLAQAPYMLGDFFGRSASNSSIGRFVSEAVHHEVGSASAFAGNDLHLIELNGNGNYVLRGGPGALLPGSFLSPAISPPVPDRVTGLTLDGDDGSYTSIGTDRQRDVFDNPGDVAATLPSARIFEIYEAFEVAIPGPNVADIVGRVRLQDNNSALPRDRIYFDYNYFHNVPLAANGVDVNRFAPGLEKTFWDGMGSIELRVPMAVTLSSDIMVGAPLDDSQFEFGNIMVAPKVLLVAGDTMAIAAGLGVSLPTSEDLSLLTTDGDRLLEVASDSVHLVPYLAVSYASQDMDWFAHSFLTFDFDTNGNTVAANQGSGLDIIGTWNDQTLMSVSGALGRYIYRNDCYNAKLQGIALSGELHYTTSIGSADVVEAGAFRVGEAGRDLSLLNGTVGLHVQSDTSTATLGYSLPLTSEDRVFDGEFRFFINRFF